MSPARQAALGVLTRPDYLAFPTVDGPCVGLYSDVLNAWSVWPDDGQITSASWAADPLFARETAFLNDASLRAKGIGAITANSTYLAIGSPSNAQVLAQVRSLTQQTNALIRLFLQQLDSTAGT